LEVIVRQVAKDDPAAAEELRLGLLGSVEILGRFPFIGPAYERDRTGRAREILYRRFRVFYRVREAQRQVQILTVWHGARQEPRFPR
jgi:plasmid stabilization system protein ParE